MIEDTADVPPPAADAPVYPPAVRPPGSPIHPRNWPIRLKLGALLLVLGVLPALLIALVLVGQATQLSHDTQAAATAAHARSDATLVSGYLQREVQVIGGVAASDPALVLATQPGSAQDQQIQQYRLAPLFDLALAAAPELHSGTLYVTTPGGTVLASTRAALLAGTVASALAVQEAIVSRAAAAVIERAHGTSGKSLVVAVPIVRNGTVVGVAVGEFDPQGLLDTLSAAGGSLVLADGRRIDGALPDGAPLQLLGTPLAPPAASQRPAAVQAVAAGQIAALPDGSRVAPIGSGALVVAPLGAAGSVLDSGAVRLGLALLALLVVALALFSTSWFTRPLLVLERSLAPVRDGNYGMRVPVQQLDEVGEISTTVNMLLARAQTLVIDLDSQRLELENGIITLFTELADAAGGDLTVRPTMSEGSLGAVADSVGILLERFSTTVKHIQATAGAVSSGTSQVASTVLRVSQEAQKQALQLASGARAIAEMAQSAQSVSQRTLAATDVASQAVAAVDSGNKAVTFARDAVKRTGDTSKKAARQVKSLGESAQLMGNALVLVQRNTEELHLIAGNASIEAARYAENGGVFRTVADSIEQLAQQSQAALRQIQSVVENTQRETARVVVAIEEVTTEVTNVARAVSLAGENFDTINMVVQRLADLNMFIASASEQQARQAVDVAEVIGALNQVSVQTSMNTAASAEAAVRLRQLTEQLNDSVSTLKVS